MAGMPDRRAARELLMKLAYQMDVNADFSDAVYDAFLSEHAADYETADPNYFKAGFSAIKAYLSHIDETITEASANWKLNRISKVELAILRLATAEILYMPDIPAAVSVNEAVELSQKFSGNRASSFVNGVLGRIARARQGADA
jgi:N utilization substance protein B